MSIKMMLRIPAIRHPNQSLLNAKNIRHQTSDISHLNCEMTTTKKASTKDFPYLRRLVDAKSFKPLGCSKDIALSYIAENDNYNRMFRSLELGATNLSNLVKNASFRVLSWKGYLTEDVKDRIEILKDEYKRKMEEKKMKKEADKLLKRKMEEGNEDDTYRPPEDFEGMFSKINLDSLMDKNFDADALLDESFRSIENSRNGRGAINVHSSPRRNDDDDESSSSSSSSKEKRRKHLTDLTERERDDDSVFAGLINNCPSGSKQRHGSNVSVKKEHEAEAGARSCADSDEEMPTAKQLYYWINHTSRKGNFVIDGHPKLKIRSVVFDPESGQFKIKLAENGDDGAEPGSGSGSILESASRSCIGESSM